MGFNFQTGSPADLFDEDDQKLITDMLQARFGPNVPLGVGTEPFWLPDELGWSWWRDLQNFALESLGPNGSRNIAAVDVWNAVYVDAQVDRVVLRPSDLNPQKPKKPESLLQRLFRRRSKTPVNTHAHAAMSAMVEEFGARPGERGGMQVGNLRGLHAELTQLLIQIGTEPNEAAVDELRRSYSQSDDDDRIDADPAIQCLTHAWLTSLHALKHKSPMWVQK